MTLGPLMIDVAGLTLDAEDRDVLSNPLIGGIILFSRNYQSREQVADLISQIRAIRTPELLIAVDQEGGRVQRFRDGFTRLPPVRWLGRLHDVDSKEARQMAMLSARLMATELLELGVDFSFAPVVDLDRGLCEVIGDRAFHSNPEVVSALGLAYMQGMRQGGMAAIAKHFPGHGGVVGDSHHVLPEDRRSYADILDDIEPYRSLIGDGLRGVLMPHILYPQVDSIIASLSARWMRNILREELGFPGVIFSDDLSMAGARVGGDVTSRSLTALEAGADMILICNDRPSVLPVLEALKGYANPSSYGRLAAMRPNKTRYANAPYGSEAWKTMCTTLATALEAPQLELDGNS